MKSTFHSPLYTRQHQPTTNPPSEDWKYNIRYVYIVKFISWTAFLFNQKINSLVWRIVDNIFVYMLNLYMLIYMKLRKTGWKKIFKSTLRPRMFYVCILHIFFMWNLDNVIIILNLPTTFLVSVPVLRHNCLIWW